MSTLSEFLKLEENQAIVLDRIVEILRTSGSWGKRGLFVKVANDTGFSAAYVGQVLTGKKPLTDEFVGKIADYLKVSVKYLRGEESEGLRVLMPSMSIKANLRKSQAKTDDTANKKTPARVVEFLKIAVAGSSLSDVASKSGINESEIIQYMAGISCASEKTLLKLSQFSGLPSEFFLGKGSCPFGQALDYVVEELRGIARDQSDISPQEKLEIIEAADDVENSLRPLAKTSDDMEVERQIIYTVLTLPKERKPDIQESVRVLQKMMPHDPKIENRDSLFMLCGLLFGLNSDNKNDA